MLRLNIILFLCLAVFINPITAQAKLYGSVSNDLFFTYPELRELAENDLRRSLKKKLKLVFAKPLNGQTNSPVNNHLLFDPRTKRKFFRVIHWNLERGYKLDALDQALNRTPQYLKENDINKKDPIRKDLFYADLKMFNEAQVFTLNEADFGMKRTNYINAVKRFAEITQSKYYSYVPEFIEIDKKYLDDPSLDKQRYKAFHGNAIVSKYPIVSTEVIKLPECYNWFTGEQKKLSILEKIKRRSAKIFFKAPIISELRRGNRNALLARINIPDSQEDVTVITTHFENRCLPKCRKKQLKYLLKKIKKIKTPVILSGDFNNSEVSAEPTSITNIVGRTLTDWQNLARVTASWFNPISWILTPSFFIVNTVRKAHDPTVFGLPLYFRNKSADLFWQLINFEFKDGNMFDFSDAKELCYKGRDGKLANSNQRVAKGFASTFRLIENNILTHFRFDWLFVKPLRVKGCQDNEDDFEDIKPECKRFIPAFARNLTELNYSYNKVFSKEVRKNTYRDFALNKLSDHDPITCKILI